MNSHRRAASVRLLKFSREIAERLPAEWQSAELPGRTARSGAEVVPFRPPDDPPPPAMAQALAA